MIKHFLSLLFEGKPDDTYILVWINGEPKVSAWFHTVDDAAAYIEEHKGEQIYIGCALSPTDNGPTRRCDASTVAAIIALWADVDVAGPAHQKQALPPDIDAALALVPAAFPPSVVVHSGHGVHLWWLLKEAYVIESDQDRTYVQETLRLWEKYVQLRAAEKGWKIDSTSDLARVLRVPGTVNVKPGCDAVPVTIREQADYRYNLSEFADFVGGIKALVHKGDTLHRPAPTANGGLIIAGQRELAPHKLAALLEVDMLFRQTWHHTRPDGAGWSQSEYDMALANIGHEAGLSDQEIADALIQNRALFGKNQKLRLDYYQRTLAKAHSKLNETLKPLVQDVDVEQPPADLRDMEPPTGAAAALPQSADFEAKRQKGIDYLGVQLGLPLLKILKIKGTNPTYKFMCEGNRTISLDLQALANPESFRRAVFGQINKLPRPFKKKDWEEKVMFVIGNVNFELDAPEATEEGSCSALVQEYIAEHGVAVSHAEVTKDRGTGRTRPFIHTTVVADCERRVIALSAGHFASWVYRKHGARYDGRTVASMLTSIGAVTLKFGSRGNLPQSRWLLPADEWPPETFTDIYMRRQVGAEEDDE